MKGVIEKLRTVYYKVELSSTDLENLASEMLKNNTSEDILLMNRIQFNNAVNKAVKKVKLEGAVENNV